MSYERFAELFDEWKASGISLGAFLVRRGYAPSDCPRSSYRKIGNALIKAVGVPEHTKRAIFKMYVKEANE